MDTCEICKAPISSKDFSSFCDTGDEIILCGLCKKMVDNNKKVAIKKATTQVKPSHYSVMTQDVISFCLINKLDFMQGNIIKYVCRYQNKNGLEDLKKAKDYIDRLIKMVESGEHS